MLAAALCGRLIMAEIEGEYLPNLSEKVSDFADDDLIHSIDVSQASSNPDAPMGKSYKVKLLSLWNDYLKPKAEGLFSIVQDLLSPSETSVLSTAGLVPELSKKMNIEGTAYLIVEGLGTPTENGAKLIAAVATGKYVYLAGGVYDVGSTQLAPTNGISGLVHHTEVGILVSITNRILGNSPDAVLKVDTPYPICSLQVVNQGSGAAISLGENVTLEEVIASGVIQHGMKVSGVLTNCGFSNVGSIFFEYTVITQTEIEISPGEVIALTNRSIMNSCDFVRGTDSIPDKDYLFSMVDATSLITNCKFTGMEYLLTNAIIEDLRGSVTFSTFDFPLFETGVNAVSMDPDTDPEGIMDGRNIHIGEPIPLLAKIQSEAAALPDPDGTNQDEILGGILDILRSVIP